ncbi:MULTISPECIES: hypothetical protein [Streptomyces]|uniref:Uncharacterized protein n=1 Tax=Streptomyces sanyensis TaxID=568869 RepID=A0ABP9B6F3_9ACTN
MNEGLPRLWAAAYGSHTGRPRRCAARAALRVLRFVRALALADHTPPAGY